MKTSNYLDKHWDSLIFGWNVLFYVTIEEFTHNHPYYGEFLGVEITEESIFFNPFPRESMKMLRLTTNGSIGVAFALLAVLCWSTAIILSKQSLEQFDSNQLFITQLLSATVFSWLFLILKKQKISLQPEMLKNYLLGFLEPFLAYTFSLYGMTLISASTTSILFSTESLMIVLLSLSLLKHHIDDKKLFFALLIISFAGVVLVALPDITASEKDNLWGYFWVLLGVFCAALYVFFSSQIVANQQPVALLTGQLSFCSILSLSIFLPFITWERQPFNESIVAIISGVLQYFLAFVFYLHALKYISANLAGMMLYFIPVAVMIMSFCFLSEIIHLLQAVGGILTILSIAYLAYRFE
ncbi:MAG: EamA family transporter [Proteobacteria bacterium]|nr:MAG: EamA family transporter [Pseudomonadota bacterium]